MKQGLSIALLSLALASCSGGGDDNKVEVNNPNKKRPHKHHDDDDHHHHERHCDLKRNDWDSLINKIEANEFYTPNVAYNCYEQRHKKNVSCTGGWLRFCADWQNNYNSITCTNRGTKAALLSLAQDAEAAGATLYSEGCRARFTTWASGIYYEIDFNYPLDVNPVLEVIVEEQSRKKDKKTTITRFPVYGCGTGGIGCSYW